MDFERYYIELLDILNSACKKIAMGRYDQSDVDRLFDLAKQQKYPSLFCELAESFGMMMAKLEARDFQMKQIIEELEKTKTLD